MKEATSGFSLSYENDGSLRICYDDFGVSEFGGGDYEKSYTLDKENAEKLKAALSELLKGTLEEMMEAYFGREFSDSKFRHLCRECGIQFSSSFWISPSDSDGFYGEPY